MSRVERSPLTVPAGVDVNIDIKSGCIKAKGKNGALATKLEPAVLVVKEGDKIKFTPRDGFPSAGMIAGTIRALVKNMIIGVGEGYQRKLVLEGVGYRAQTQGSVLNLALGFSHPIKFDLPKGVSATTPSQTEIVLASADRQMLGQVAATIRNFRPPEPYKGKGIRYEGEVIVYKEGKKK